MIESGQSTRFLVELLAALLQFVGGCVWVWQGFFDSTETSLQTQILSSVGGTHAASTYELDNSVAVPEDCIWRKCPRQLARS